MPQSNLSIRSWADPWPRQVQRLQTLAPPAWDRRNNRSTHQLLFIHIPKCAGSSFRNGGSGLIATVDDRLPLMDHGTYSSDP